MRPLLIVLSAITTLVTAAPAAAQTDLLHAVATDLAVSSAYRGRLRQVARLVDGDLASAWNSESGELVGTWLDVRVPETATVESLLMTVGFTRSGRRDLFTGNHRVTQVRVLREGVSVGEYDLDPNERGLQTIPIGRPGGSYRVEVLAVQPGSNRAWREVCISELRVMGQAPGQAPGTRFPRLAVGSLPPTATAPTGEPAQAALSTALRRFSTEWRRLMSEEGSRQTACALDEQEERETGTYHHRREAYLLEVAQLVDPIDAPRGDALRAAAFTPNRSGWQVLTPVDHDLVTAALQAVVDHVNDRALRCRWADASAGLHLQRAVDDLRAAYHGCEHLDMDYPDGAPRDEVRSCRQVYRAEPRFHELGNGPRSMRSRARRLRAQSLPDALTAAVPPLGPRWRAMQAALEAAQSSCGWE